MKNNCICFLVLWLCCTTAFGQGPGLGNLTYNSNELYNEISQFTTTNGAPRGHGYVVMHGGYMAVIFSSDAGGGNGNGGFAFYDVSDPRNPVNVFTTEDNPSYTNENLFNYVGNIGEAHGFQQIGNRIALCTNRPGGMQIWEWDMNNPSAPQKIGEIDLVTQIKYFVN